MQDIPDAVGSGETMTIVVPTVDDIRSGRRGGNTATVILDQFTDNFTRHEDLGARALYLAGMTKDEETTSYMVQCAPKAWKNDRALYFRDMVAVAVGGQVEQVSRNTSSRKPVKHIPLIEEWARPSKPSVGRIMDKEGSSRLVDFVKREIESDLDRNQSDRSSDRGVGERTELLIQLGVAALLTDYRVDAALLFAQQMGKFVSDQEMMTAAVNELKSASGGNSNEVPVGTIKEGAARRIRTVQNFSDFQSAIAVGTWDVIDRWRDSQRVIPPEAVADLHARLESEQQIRTLAGDGNADDVLKAETALDVVAEEIAKVEAAQEVAWKMVAALYPEMSSVDAQMEQICAGRRFSHDLAVPDEHTRGSLLPNVRDLELYASFGEMQELAENAKEKLMKIVEEMTESREVVQQIEGEGAVVAAVPEVPKDVGESVVVAAVPEATVGKPASDIGAVSEYQVGTDAGRTQRRGLGKFGGMIRKRRR